MGYGTHQRRMRREGRVFLMSVLHSAHKTSQRKPAEEGGGGGGGGGGRDDNSDPVASGCTHD